MEQNRCPGCMEIKSGGAVCEHCGYDERRENEPHQLQVGTVLQGKYLVGRVLGQGGFGITYLGWNLYLENKVAIKEYYPATVVDRTATQNTSVVCKTSTMENFFASNRLRFLREAQTLAKLQSVPQIVSIHDFFEVNNTAYIIMEYLQGDDLRHYLRKRGGVLSPRETFNIMRPVMAALAKVHEAGMVHRDISPDNIMLQYDGSVKLMDFGAVRSVENPGVDKELTQATQAIVKHGFAPIEQYSAKGSIGPWTDEYALCATMYYCMTGKVPENAPDRIQDETDLEWDRIPGLTAHQIEILRKGTAPRARDRHSNIRELMNALFAEPAPQPQPQPISVPQPQLVPQPQTQPVPVRQPQLASVPQPPRPTTKKKSGKLAIVAALGVAVLIAVILMVLPKGWVQQDNGWNYYRMGAKATGWNEIESDTYYFDQNGFMLTGWQEVDGNRYYFGTDGKMAIGSQRKNGRECYFDRDGNVLTGWQKFDGNRYYFDKDGKMIVRTKLVKNVEYYYDQNDKLLSGWLTMDGVKYYFGKTGKPMTGLREIHGDWYYFDGEGKMQTGFQRVGNNRHYFEDDGKMVVSSWKEIGGDKYFFDREGKPLVDFWYVDGVGYCFDRDGKMMTGWVKDTDGKSYFFNQEGAMAVGCWEIDGDIYLFDENGAMLTGWQQYGGYWYDFGTDGRLVR